MKEWVKLLLLGLLSLAFGIYVLGNTFVASVVVTGFVGVLLLITGGFQIIASLLGDDGAGMRIFSVLMGLVMVFLGGSFLFNPLEGIVSLAMLVVILLIAAGLLRLWFSFRMRGTQYFWPMLLSGALSILLGGYIVANFEQVGLDLLGILLGVEMVLNGTGLVFMAFFLRTAAKRMNM